MTDLWYALHVKPRFEKYVQTHLQEKGYEVFLPTYTSTRKWSDRVKAISLPLFPSYLFCRFQIQSRLPILITPGVNFIVGAGKSPMPVHQEEINAIRIVMDSGVATQPWPYLNVGQTVRVEDGPLEGLSGIVTRIKGRNRLIVSVNLLMRSVAVELERASVKPLHGSEDLVVPGIARDKMAEVFETIPPTRASYDEDDRELTSASRSR